MLRVIFALAYIVAVIEPTLISQRAHDVAGDGDVDLGSYDAKVNIGKLPSVYKLTKADEKASANAIQIIEKLRSLFPTGILTIPPLDPYKNNNFNPIIIDKEDSALLTGKVEIKEVLIEGGKSFNLKSLQIRMKNNLRADFDVKIPTLSGHASFYADLTLGNILPVKVNGKVNFKLNEISVSGAADTAETSHDNKKIYRVQNVKANFHADELHVSLKGLGKRMLEDVLRFLKKANLQNAPAVESTRKLINNYVTKTIIEEVNKMLKGFSVEQIKGFLQS